MGRREIIVYTDDVTGKESDTIKTEIVTVDGVAFEVDMSPETLAAYRKAVEPYRAAGKRVGRANSAGNVLRPIGSASSVRTGAAKTVPDKEQNRAIREWWAKNQGRDGLPPLVERGRIASEVVTAFHKHGGRAIPPPPAPEVPAAKEPRKAGTIGAEVRLPRQTKSAPVKAASAKTPRKTAASASVKSAKVTASAAPTGRRRVAAK